MVPSCVMAEKRGKPLTISSELRDSIRRAFSSHDLMAADRIVEALRFNRKANYYDVQATFEEAEPRFDRFEFEDWMQELDDISRG